MLLGQVNRFKINKHTPRAIVTPLDLALDRNYKTVAEDPQRAREEDPSAQTKK